MDEQKKASKAAEDRGLLLFNRLVKKSSSELNLPVDYDYEDNLSLSVDMVSSGHLSSLTSGEGRASKRLATRSAISSPPTASLNFPRSRTTQGRKENYPGGLPSSSLSPQSLLASNDDITITFQYGQQKVKMTLRPTTTIENVKSMVSKKLSAKQLLPESLTLSLDGRELLDHYILINIPVRNGALIKVTINEKQVDDDSFLQDRYQDQRTLSQVNTSSSFFSPATPNSDVKFSSSKQTHLTSAPPSSIKKTSFVSSPHVNDISYSDIPYHSIVSSAHVKNHMRTLHRQFDRQDSNMSDSITIVSDNDPAATNSSALRSSVYGGVITMSEEAAFYQILEEFMENKGDDSIIRAKELNSKDTQSKLAERYAEEVASRYETLQAKQKTRGSRGKEILQDLEDLRAERDFWSLAEQLLLVDLLKDINDQSNEQTLNAALASISPSASLKEVLEKSIRSDERIKKGRVLKDWIEKCSSDNVDLPPDDSDFSWKDTLKRLRVMKKKVSGSPTSVMHMHPDAQVTQSGGMIPLDGGDNTDQETLMKVIWYFIRCGQITDAQDVASKHNVHWLSAALMGVAEEFYKLDERESCKGDIRRCGNKNRPLWVQTCWKYATSLHSNSSNKTLSGGSRNPIVATSQVATLEASIYAALSANYDVLQESILLQTYMDHLWAKISCAHARQIASVTNYFRNKRREFSDLYPGTSDKVTQAEEKYLVETENLQSAFSSNGRDLIKDLTQYFSKGRHSVSAISIHILQLQSALIQGKTAVRSYILNDIRAYALEAKSNSSSSITSGDRSYDSSDQCRLLRVYVHFLIWLRFSCEQHKDLCSLVPDDIFYLTLEAYIDHLVQRQQYSLVALYCSYMSRPKRLSIYMAMMRIISPTALRSEEGHIVPAASLKMGTSTMAGTLMSQADITCMALSGRQGGLRGIDDNATALEVLMLAKRFFEQEDIVEITKSVVDIARKGKQLTTTSLSATFMGFTGTLKNTENFGQTFSTGALNMSNVAAQTTIAVPGCYDEGNIPVEDAQRMESLRWLCYYEDQFLHAAKEANAFLRSFMLESSGEKTLQIRILLNNILPKDFVIVGTNSLDSQLRNENDTARSRCLLRCWDADIGQLELWKHVDYSIMCHEKFKKIVEDFYNQKDKIIGPVTILQSLKYDILRFAEQCLSSIRKALVCVDIHGNKDASFHGGRFEGSDRPYEDRGGFQAIWSASINATIDELTLLLSTHATDINSGDTDFTDIQDLAVVDSMIQESFSMIDALQRNESTVHNDGHISSLYSPPAGLKEVRGYLDDIKRKATVTFDTSYVVEKVRDMLGSIGDNRMAMKMVVNILLKNYIDVCSSTATILEIVESEVGIILEWQQRAVDVAVLLADEAVDMQLYRSLEVNDLKLILASVCSANMNILRIKKSFDI